MITKIEINGFKTFSNFSMEFSPLTVIAGTNASGKSNLFDALNLLSCLASTDLRTAFANKQLRGGVSELFTKIDDEHSMTEMSFAVELLVNRKVQDNWGGFAEIKTPRMRYELHIAIRKSELGYDEPEVVFERLTRIPKEKDEWVKRYLKKRQDLWGNPKGGGSAKPYIDTETIKGHPTITIRQDGRQGRKSISATTASQTVLSSINSVDFPHIYAVQKEIANWYFMQLVPEILREPTRYDTSYGNSIIGHSGENLSAALYRLKNKDEYILNKIIIKLSSFLPEYTKLNVRDDKANKQFVFELTNSENRTFSSRVLSEGTLRLLVLCVLLYDDEYNGLLCFEEPENGIHPFRMQSMADLLKQLASDFADDDNALRQVIVNTHSPVLLKYLTDANLNSDENVSIWFSKMISHKTTDGGSSHMIRVSKTLPVTKSFQTTLDPIQKGMTAADAMNYLNYNNLTREEI